MKALCLGLSLLLSIGFASGAETRRYSDEDSSEVIRRAKTHDVEAIAEIGLRGDRSQIPLLKTIMNELPPPKSEQVRKASGAIGRVQRAGESNRIDRYLLANSEAQVALARLGDKDAISQYIKALSSEDEQDVSQGIVKLGRIGNRGTVRYLMPFLDDTSGKELLRSAHPATISHDMTALAALNSILPDVAAQIEEENSKTHVIRRELWRKWWKKNRESFEKGNPDPLR